MEDHTLHTNTQPAPTSYSLHWAVIQPSRRGREGKVSGCSILWIPGVAGVEVCSMFSLVIVCPGLQGALFTGADMPGAAESPNCFTASLSCVRCSLWTWISHREKLRGHGGEHCPCPVLKTTPMCKCTDTQKVSALWGVSREVSNSPTDYWREL